jgi:cation diffusion facilitator family transporter
MATSRSQIAATTVAFGADAGIAAAKFFGFLVSGSSAMLAESVHSVADTINQLLLIIGKRQARRQPDRLHQFGYGRSRYFYSFVVAMMTFAMGSVFALYEGYRKLTNPKPLTAPWVAIAIVVVAALLEGYSLRNARMESKPLRDSHSWWHFIRNSRTPELPVVLLEDSAALIGLSLAFAGVGLTILTGAPVWDAVGTLGIGALLGGCAVVLIIETHSLLIGEGATREQYTTIRSVLEATEGVHRIVDMRTQYLAPDELLVVAKVVFGRQLELAAAAHAVAIAEKQVRSAVPAVQMIYLQPDVENV